MAAEASQPPAEATARQSATARLHDPALARAERWAKIDDLQRRIAGLEGAAKNQDDLADQLEHTGKGKNDAITKIFNAVASVPAIPYRGGKVSRRSGTTARGTGSNRKPIHRQRRRSLASFTLVCRNAVSYFPDTAVKRFTRSFPYDGQARSYPFVRRIGTDKR